MSGHGIFLKVGAFFSRIFSTKYNPIYHLGTLAIYFFAIAFVSGIYLFLFYKVDPTQSYISTVELTKQWVGNLMRNLHRYSSDLFVVFVVLHFLHMLITGKFKRVKSWLFGIVSLIITIFIGLTGFVLVWDQKAKLLGVLTAKLLIYLPFFDPSIAGAFLINDLAYLGGIFRVTLFGHIFFCAFTAIFLWLHEIHLSKPGIFPPKKIMLFSGFFILLISLFFDASLDAPAQDTVLPTETGFNWYYFFGYFFMKILSVGWNWVLISIVTLFIFSFPFLFKKNKNYIPVINTDLCDGCQQCAEDCPYDSILIKQNEKGEDKAWLDNEKCVGCNICVGSCKSMAITSEKIVPNLINSAGNTRLHIITCSYLKSKLNRLDLQNTKISEAICVGNINAKAFDETLVSEKNKLIILGCESCYYRFGPEWAKSRLSHKRRPVIKSSVNYSNILFVTSGQNIKKTISDFINTANVGSNKKELTVKDFSKVNIAFAILLSALFFVSIPYFSNQKLSFYSTKSRTLVLNLKYTSSPIHELQNNSSHLSHMQSPVPIISGRSAIKIEIFNTRNNTLVFSKNYSPRGIRKDIAVYVYDEVEIPENIKIILSETEFPEVKHELSNIQLMKGESRVLRFLSGKLTL